VNIHIPLAIPNHAVHKGGINAVAIATHGITVKDLSFLVIAIIPATPQHNAIITSHTVGLVLTIISLVGLVKGLKVKYNVATSTLTTAANKRFLPDFITISRSYLAIHTPNPIIGHIKGESSIAPITTAVEFILRPTLQITIAMIKIHTFAHLNVILSLIELIISIIFA